MSGRVIVSASPRGISFDERLNQGYFSVTAMKGTVRGSDLSLEQSLPVNAEDYVGQQYELEHTSAQNDLLRELV